MMKTNRINAHKKHIVVVGGGFAGINFVQKMYNNKAYSVTLIDKHNYNYFTPLLYQVATGFLEPSSISYPFRKLLQGKNTSFRMASVTRIDPPKNLICLEDGTLINYDYLVLAAGAKPNYFGNESVKRNGIPLKEIEDALYMRNSLVSILEAASVERDPQEKQRLLTIVIAGGGPTGVEVAGMLAELKDILCREYPEVDPAMVKVYVIDGAPSLVAPMSERSHQSAERILTSQGIEVILNTTVEGFDGVEVQLSNGARIASKTLIWAAGVKAVRFEGISPTSIGKGGRMVTDAFHRVREYKNIFAIGDMSMQLHDPDYPQGHPQLAQPAIQQGKSLARNFRRLHEGRSLVPFDYFDRGEMAIIGRKHALVDLFKQKVHFGGLLGLLSWLFIHLISLVSYNNKVKTLYTWAIAYITRDQALRLIFKLSPKSGNKRGIDLDEAA